MVNKKEKTFFEHIDWTSAVVDVTSASAELADNTKEKADAERVDNEVQAVEIQSTPTVKIQGIQEVIISDINMPFGSIVVFIIKWALASIPAFLILAFLFSIFGGLFVGIIATLQAIF